MNRNLAATAASSKGRNRNMKPTQQPKTAARESLRALSFVEPFSESFSSDGIQWPPVEVPRRLRTRIVVDTTLRRCRSVKPDAMLGVKVATGRRGGTGLRPRRPVPFPPSRVPSSHLSGVLQALEIDHAYDVVGSLVGTLVTKIQSSDCSAFAAYDSIASVIQGSEVSDVAEALIQLSQQNMKLHPVLGIFVPTLPRGSRCRARALLNLLFRSC